MNIIGIYSGKYQPPHLGNYKAYQFLKKITGSNTFIATDDKIDLPDSPLTFQDKQQIWTRHGVPIDKVVMTKDPSKAVEVTKKFGPDRTVAIFAMSGGEAMVALKSENKYFIPYKGLSSNMEPMVSHAYVLVIPDNILHIDKNGSFSNTTVRQAFGSERLSEEQKKSYFKQLFGWYDISLFDLIKKKFAEANVVKERLNENKTMVLRRFLKPFVKEILGQLSQPEGNQATQINPLQQSTQLTNPEDAAKLAKDQAKKEMELNRQLLKQKELALKTTNLNKTAKRQEVDQLSRDIIPGLKRDISALKNKI